MRRVIVGFSGGVTSAWCAGWALRSYPREEVVLLWHDTKEEHPDTYRFLREMSAKLNMPITERSDGRSVTEVFRDEGFLGNGQNAMCSRILKREPGERYVEELKAQGATEIIFVFGFSAREEGRRQRMFAQGLRDGWTARFPVAEENVTKQQCSDWCKAQGVCPSAMYLWSGHANCVGCVKGGRAYWLAVKENAPEVYAQRSALEVEFGHSIIRGDLREGETHRPFLSELPARGLRRKVADKESIEIGPCECGD